MANPQPPDGSYRSTGWTQQLTSFFQSMYNRMVARAAANNPPGSGNIGSSPAMTSTSGNLGGGMVPIGNIAVYPDPKSEGFIREGYSKNASIYTIVSMVARRFAYLPRYVYQVKDPVAARSYKHYIKGMDGQLKHRKEIKALFTKAYDETIVDSKLSELLARPNPMQGQDAFFELVETYYDVLGEAVIWCNRGTDSQDLPLIAGQILEMWILPPQYMEIVPDPCNVWGSLGWIFNVAGKRIPIDNENIIHWKRPNPNFDGITREHMRGLSPLRPGNKKITEDESATDASVSMHQNNGARAVIFDKNIGSKMTATQETQIRGVIDKKVNNNEMKGAVAYVQGDLGLIDLAMSSVDQELEKSKENILARLCNLMAVSPYLFLLNGTYQNVLQARKDLMTNNILPKCCSLRDEMNRVLLPAFGLSPTKFTTDVDVTQIPELQDDMTSMVTSLGLAWWLTPNERRNEMDFESNEDDGSDDIWIPTTLQRMDDAAMPQQDPNSFNDDLNTDDPTKPTSNVGGKDSTDSGK